MTPHPHSFRTTYEMCIALFQHGPILMSPSPVHPELIDLRVPIDSGPNAREVGIVCVSADAAVSAMRTEVAVQIARSSMCLFKVNYQQVTPLPRSHQSPPCGARVLSTLPNTDHHHVSIPWKANSEATVYTHNLDDPSQLAATIGVRFPACTRST